MKSRNIIVLQIVAFFSLMIAVIASAITFSDTVSTPNLIGLIAGSFGAGATLSNLIRDYVSLRKNK
jgi:hypothetical protein